MKIDLNSSAANLASQDWTAHKAPQTAESAQTGATEDRVTLASAGPSVQSLTARAMQTPQIRQEKVDALRQAVASGSYAVDSEKTASAMAAENEF